jgi:hypothetical protein
MARWWIGILCLLALMATRVPALALDVAPSQFEEKLKTYDPGAVEAARNYARIANLKQILENAVPVLRQTMVAQLKAKNPALKDEQINTFLETFLKSAFVDDGPIIEQASILLMLEILSKDEIVAVNQFYSSPMGQQILKKMPIYLSRMPEVMGVIQTYIIPRALDAAHARMKKDGVDVQL